MTTLALKQIRPLRTTRSLSMFDSVWVRIILVACIFSLIVLQVLATSRSSTAGYTMNEYQAHIQQLKQENQRLDVEIATYRSMANIQQRLEGTSFVATAGAQFITLVGSDVARR
jgi:cell division protein FtsB